MPLLETDRELTRHSYYAATASPGEVFAPLRGAASCEVAVVGGGLAGLSAALELAERGRDVVLLEAEQIGFGASGRNGGQALCGLACGEELIEQQLGLDEARRVWAMSLEAVALIRERIARHGIDCDWQDGYLALAVGARKGRALAAWTERIGRVYGHPVTAIAPAEIGRWIASTRFHSGVHDASAGHLHPLKYTHGLARAAAAAGARLHEGSAVLQLTPGARPVLRTADGELQAQQVLLAGNVYLLDHLHGLGDVLQSLHARIMPVGTYIGCTEPLPDTVAGALIPSRAAVCDTNFVLDYFRPTADRRLLYGGRVSYSKVAPSDLAGSMKRRMVATFPQLRDTRIEYAWGGFVDISMNRAPDFGRLQVAGQPDNIYYLQGFSGHGLALSGLAGRLVAEAMTGDAARFDVFARLRHRPFPGGRRLRTPALVLGMAWYRLRDILG